MRNRQRNTHSTTSETVSSRFVQSDVVANAQVTPQTVTHYALRIRRYAIQLVLAVFIVLTTSYSILTPAFETPDEIWHFAFIQHVTTGQGLPVSEPNSQAMWRQQGVQAPGYYLAAAALTAWIDQTDFPTIYDRANPHRAIGQPDAPGNRNYLIHYPDAEGWPWQGSILALHIARFFSIFLGAVTVYAVYRTLDLLLEPPAALLGAAFVAFIPQFVFISAAASNDNAINATAALVLWQIVVMVRQGNEATRRQDDKFASRNSQFAILGTFLGLALISKLSALTLLGLAGLAVLWVAWRQRSWRIIGDAILWIGAPVLLIAGWWYWRNWQLYSDPLAWNVWEANILLRVVPADWGIIAGELGSLFRSFWGLFGWMNVPYPEWIYTGFGVLTIGIGMGLVAWVVRWVYTSLALPAADAAPGEEGTAATQKQSDSQHGNSPPPALRGELEGGFLFLWLGLLIFSWLRFMEIAPAAQGRYFFPAAATLGLIFVLACRSVGIRLGMRLGWGIVTILAILTAVTPFWVIRPIYAAPQPQIAAPQPASATFGLASEQVAILAVTASPAIVRPGDVAQVEVTWQALTSLPKDYSVFVHLVDDDGFTVAQRDTMPNGGNAPTSRWLPGQVVIDTYLVDVPNTAYTPNRGQWAVGLYDYRSGQRLPRVDGGDSLVFGHVALEPPVSAANDVPNPVSVDFADGVTLIGYRFSARRLFPGDELTVTLYWQARSPISQDYTTFVHILDSGFIMHGGLDSAPPTPSSAWFEREDLVIVDPHTFVVSPDAPTGDYQLEIGLYPWPSFERLRLLDAAGAEGADRLLLGPLRVAP
ncbi:phospholipid carrier-dependent glycosyltransferase [bacterium]|nr:phospholipid carrier-dependent glycosyltransferase [bacterium]